MHSWKYIVPSISSTRALNLHTHITSHYRSWWTTKHGNYLEKGIQHLVDSSSFSLAKPKFSKKTGNDNGGKHIRMLETGGLTFGHTEESGSSNEDHYWKRTKRSDRQPICEEWFFDGVPSILEFLDITTLVVGVWSFLKPFFISQCSIYLLIITFAF